MPPMTSTTMSTSGRATSASTSVVSSVAVSSARRSSGALDADPDELERRADARGEVVGLALQQPDHLAADAPQPSSATRSGCAPMVGLRSECRCGPCAPILPCRPTATPRPTAALHVQRRSAEVERPAGRPRSRAGRAPVGPVRRRRDDRRAQDVVVVDWPSLRQYAPVAATASRSPGRGRRAARRP